jgi:hypothetical protein
MCGGDHLREQFGLLDIHDAKKNVSLAPIFNPIGSVGIFDVRSRSHDDSQFDPNVPFNNREREIAWLTSPHVLAEHFSYYTLQNLRDIRPYEFMGKGWTATDDWARTAHHEDDRVLQHDVADDRRVDH